MRKLVTLREVKALDPIPGADLIEVATVDGWRCVVKKGEFKVGDVGLYFEIDSFLPATDKRFEFLSKTFSNYKHNLGARIKTVKLRGQVSQGLLLPIYEFPEVARDSIIEVGGDYTEELGVVKWEPPDADTSGQMPPKYTRIGRFLHKFKRGPLRRHIGRLEGKYPWIFRGKTRSRFPSFIPKTDEERVQNLISNPEAIKGEWILTVKMDGSSMTVYRKGRTIGVCSRNIDLPENESDKFWAVANRYKMKKALKSLKKDIAIQGELCGPGIQGNKDKLASLDWFIFNVWDIKTQRYWEYSEVQELVNKLHDLGSPVKVVPFVKKVNTTGFEKIEYFLQEAEGPSLNAPIREGVVFSEVGGQRSFKVISNSYLLKNNE